MSGAAPLTLLTMTAAPSNMLLTYVAATAPSPLQVSPSLTEPSVATITIVVSCPPAVGSANVAQILVALPVRDTDAPDSSELAMEAPPAGCAAVVSTGSDAWEAAGGIVPGVFTFKPKSSEDPNAPKSVALASQSLTLTFTGIKISPLVGTAAIAISEWASTEGQPPPTNNPPSATGTIAVTKFPVGFFFTNFQPTGQPGVESGSPVTLTWEGSSNATYEMAYDEVRTTVSGQSWTSPRLYDDTAFKLTASATQNGQTVSLSQNATVQVLNPIVVSFQALPESVSYGQPMMLGWRASQADGVYLFSRTSAGAKREASLPAVSDDEEPFAITPPLSTSYELQAYRRRGGTEVTSPPRPLEFAFAPIKFNSFKAEPDEVTEGKPSTLVSWDVANAVTVTFQGKTVAPKDSVLDSPLDDTTYTLTYQWVDGSVTPQTVNVTSHKIVSTQYTVDTYVLANFGWGVYYRVTVEILIKAASANLVTLSKLLINGQSFQIQGMPLPTTRGWLFTSDFNSWSGSVNSVQADIWVDGQLVPGVAIPPQG